MANPALVFLGCLSSRHGGRSINLSVFFVRVEGKILVGLHYLILPPFSVSIYLKLCFPKNNYFKVNVGSPVTRSTVT